MFSFRQMLGEFESAAKLGFIIGGIVAAPVGLIALAWFFANKDQDISPDAIPEHVKQDVEKLGVPLTNESGAPRSMPEMVEAVKEGVIAKVAGDLPEGDEEKRKDAIRGTMNQIEQIAQKAESAAAPERLPELEPWRMEAFRISYEGDAIAKRHVDIDLARYSEQFFATPQEALAAWDDGFGTDAWQNFVDGVTAGLGETEIFSFDEEAAIKATGVGVVYADLEKRVMDKAASAPRQNATAPTERMISAAHKVAAEKGLDLPDIECGGAVREFLNEHSDRKLDKWQGSKRPEKMEM